MYIRRYSLASLLLLVLMGWAVFAFITQGSIQQVDLMNGYFIPEMPVAVAVLIPAVILFVATIAHMVFYKFIAYVQNRTRTADLNKLEDAIFMSLKGKTGEDKPHYSSSLYKDMGELLNVAKIELNSGAEVSKGNKFHHIVETLTTIRNGDTVEVDNSLGYHIKELNYWNALQHDPHSAEGILMERGFYSDELYREAYNNLCKVNTYSTIQRYNKWFNIDGLFNMLARVDAEEDGLTFSKEEIFDLIDSISFSKDEYLRLAQVIKDSNMSPDFRIELFKHLTEKSDDAVEGYLYTLLNLEMISDAEELMQELQPEGMVHVRAYITLKKTDPTLLDLDYFFRG